GSQIDAGSYGALVQVGSTVGIAGRQAHHGEYGHTPEDNDAQVGHTLVADVLEAGVELHPVLDDAAVVVATQAVHAAEDVRHMVLDVADADQGVIGLAEVSARGLAGDHHDAVAAAAVGRFYDEVVMLGQDVRQMGDLVFQFDAAVQLGNRDTALDGPRLGQQLVVHQRVIVVLGVGHDVLGVALVDADDAQFAQAGPGHLHGLSASFIRPRKRHSSIRR